MEEESTRSRRVLRHGEEVPSASWKVQFTSPTMIVPFVMFIGTLIASLMSVTLSPPPPSDASHESTMSVSMTTFGCRLASYW